jgi:hypothetical protein
MKKLLLTLLFLSSSAFASIDISHESGIYHIILKGEKIKKQIKFMASDELITNHEAQEKSGARLVVNTGFFDPKNQKTVSYVVTDNVISADPLLNENLVSNPALSKNMNKILNRTELRLVECGRKLHYEITAHNEPVDFECWIITTNQGGPLILPELRLEEEFFVVTENGRVTRDSISALKKTARTIAGIKNGDLHILIITNDNKMTLTEVQELCKTLGFERAMGFDGGGSTSMNYKDKYDVVSEGQGRKLKSFMLVY